jgi:Glycosyl transferase family 11
MKLIVRQLSGLGNQMFQYAAGLFYAAQHDAQVLLIIDPPHKSHSHGHPRPFLLPHFAITAQHRDLSTFDRLVLMTENRRVQPTVRRLLQKTLRVQIVTESLEQRFRFQANLPMDNGVEAVYLLGYWQVHEIAERISADLRREFAFRAPATGRNLDVLRVIRDTEQSVSLHVRRGDYTLEAEGNVALSMDYYARAIEQVKAASNNPTFFVFSDDTKFARENLPRGITTVFVDHNGPSSAHEDLRLMSSCRHHIIANSTFSWWGAWLNGSRDKMVYAPRHWLVANCPAENDLIPKDWRMLD